MTSGFSARQPGGRVCQGVDRRQQLVLDAHWCGLVHHVWTMNCLVKGTAVRVLCVHGIGQQVLGEETLLREWLPALRDGLTVAGEAVAVADTDVGMAFYGDLFRPAGQRLSVGDPPYSAADVDEDFERDFLQALWAEAARVDARVVPPDADTLLRAPGSVQAGLRALSRSRFFASVGLRAMVSDLKQVRRYLTDPDLRRSIRDRVLRLVTEDTRVVIGHSLGSVVAYEALCEYRLTCAKGKGPALVTLGSPLGIPNLVFDRLDPSPTGGVGEWPCLEGAAWTNVTDTGDVVALVKDLRPLFGLELQSYQVSNGAHAHSALPYLTDAVTGAAIAAGLR